MLGKTTQSGEPGVPDMDVSEAAGGGDAGNWTASNSAWWKFTASDTGKIAIDTYGSTAGVDGPDTLLWVFQGGPTIGSLDLIGFNDDTYFDDIDPALNRSKVVASVIAGQTYYVRVTPYNPDLDFDAILTLGTIVPGIPPAIIRFAHGAAYSDIPPAVLTLRAFPPSYQLYTARTTRWTFYDPAEDDLYTFTINPDSMEDPLKEKKLQFGFGVGAEYGRYSTLEEPREAKAWQFGGVIRSKEQHDILESWYLRDGIVNVTDHLKRTFECIIEDFQVEERKPTKAVNWRLRYTMKTLLLRQLT